MASEKNCTARIPGGFKGNKKVIGGCEWEVVCLEEGVKTNASETARNCHIKTSWAPFFASEKTGVNRCKNNRSDQHPFVLLLVLQTTSTLYPMAAAAKKFEAGALNTSSGVCAFAMLPPLSPHSFSFHCHCLIALVVFLYFLSIHHRCFILLMYQQATSPRNFEGITPKSPSTKSFTEKLDADALKYFSEVAKRPFSQQAVAFLNAYWVETKSEAEFIYTYDLQFMFHPHFFSHHLQHCVGDDQICRHALQGYFTHLQIR